MEFEWLFTPVLEIIQKILNDLVIEILEGALNLIIQFIKTPSDINAYLPVENFLGYIQVLAGALLVLKVVWEVFGQITGNIPNVSGRSIGRLVLQTLWAASLIFLLPAMVTDILIKINNYLMELVISIGGASMDIDLIKSTFIITTSSFIILLSLAWAVAFFLLAIAGAIRYVELIIAILLAPIAALSVVRGNGTLITWASDTTAIVFTQTIHVLLLQLLALIVTKTSGVMMFFLSFGVMAVVLKGPQILRKYIYSSGTGSKVMPVVGGMGRMAFSVVKK